MGVRKNQASLTAAEWTAFLNALNTIAGTAAPEPRYRDFVRVHVAAMSPVGMSWGIHSMPWMGMNGRNFLAWHRQYLLAFERRLQQVDASVSVPYWDWITHPQIPPRLTGTAFLNRWGITRQWNAALMPDQSDVGSAMSRTNFPSFQQRLESAHGEVHVAVGGTMNSSSSPADPVFWLHHANVDRLWAQWQALPIGVAPPNGTERLQPATGYRVRFGMRVTTLLNITTLAYSYA